MRLKINNNQLAVRQPRSYYQIVKFIILKTVYTIFSIALFKSLINKNTYDIIVNKYFQKGFIVYFRKNDLITAYRYRIVNAIYQEMICHSQINDRIINYLDIIIDQESLNLFNLKDCHVKYLKNRKNNFIFPTLIKSKKKIIFLGPSANLNTLYKVEDEHLVINKPVDLSIFNIQSSRIYLILNNVWSIQKKDKIVEWSRKFPKAKIFSPNKIGIENENNECFNKIPKFEKSSLMGLQRSLTILINELSFDSIKLIGFDFALSSENYKAWYPSLIPNQFNSKLEGIVHTNLIHDFLLNFMYVKKLKQQYGSKIYGSIDQYLEMPIAEVMGLFEKRMRD